MTATQQPNKPTAATSDDRSSVTSGASSNKASKSWQTTIKYVAAAAVALTLTAAIEYANRPAAIKEYGRVGEQFYPEFVDPTLATALDVQVFDADKLRPIDFRVERQANGRWVIPSHHDYPADAEEQLAKTASSIIGITRGAMVTRWPADHARYGVVNPKQESLKVDDIDGVGQRITLEKEDNTVLVDYIVGKKVEGSEGQFYVRHPDEDEVYIAKLDVDLSTKFTDWIDTDLFEFSNGEILGLSIHDYSINEGNLQTMTLTKGDTLELKRDKAWSDDWTIDGLNEESEELNKDSIRDTLSAIADLKIVGVRPKQVGLTPDLKVDRNALRSQRDLERLSLDLLESGFLLQPGETQDSFSLISREGELYAGTEDGLRYRMYFGRVFTGSEEELEIGFASSDSSKKEATKDEAEAPNDSNNNQADAEKSNSDADGDDTEAGGKPGRYLFVRVDFDKSLLGEEPKPAAEPEKPARLIELEKAEEEKPATSSDAEDKASDAEAEDSADGKGEQEESELEKLRKEFADAQSAHKENARKVEDFQEKVKEGLEKAEELNRRFAEWYYVIPGESYDKLKLSRADLVKAKEVEEDNTSADSTETAPADTPSFDAPLPVAEPAGDSQTDESASAAPDADDSGEDTDPESSLEAPEPVDSGESADAPIDENGPDSGDEP